jgi:hypothetical protein
MPTAVPQIEFTPAGLVIPTESEILDGVLTDMDTAFGGGMNLALETPQGQIATSQSASIANKNAEIATVVNQVDPLYSSGRFQDAIARIYFLTRKPATSTAVTATLGGLPGTVIPSGTLAQDTSGNTYASTGAATIGVGSTVSVEFQNVLTGPIPCAENTLTRVFQAIAGWDTIDNAAAGTLGQVVENRADFELRRRQSVALNGRSTPNAIFAAVFEADNVLDCYVIDNAIAVATMTAAISGVTLTVSAMSAGYLVIGSIIAGDGVTADTFVTAFGTGEGGAGTYTLNNSQSVGSRTMTAPGVVVGVTEYPLAAHSVYVAAVGGLDQDVGEAIWSKKDVGCSYNGNTTVTVTDTSGYNYPQPTYEVKFERPSSLPIFFEVEIVNDPTLPSDIVARVKAAILARFNGTDGTQREKIGALVLASRYYGAVTASAQNVSLLSILIGTATPTLTQVPVGIDQRPTLDVTDITVTLV